MVSLDGLHPPRPPDPLTPLLDLFCSQNNPRILTLTVGVPVCVPPGALPGVRWPTRGRGALRPPDADWRLGNPTGLLVRYFEPILYLSLFLSLSFSLSMSLSLPSPSLFPSLSLFSPSPCLSLSISPPSLSHPLSAILWANSLQRVLSFPNFPCGLNSAQEARDAFK